MATLNKTNLQQQLLPIVNSFVEIYKANLTRADARASGKLIDTIKGQVNYDGKFVTVDIVLQDYWKYVEGGRRPGKFPPIDKIREWIRVKPVLPRPMANGKLPTENQLAFLISRSIAEKGIKPRPVLKESLNTFQLAQKIGDQIINMLQEEINK